MLLREQVVLAWGRCRVVGMTKRWGLGTVFQDPTVKCVVAVSYSPTPSQVQYHRRLRA